MITKVTITGADNSIQPAELLNLQRLYPFVEWGILVSRSSQGRYRFPSFDWILTLAHYQRSLELAGERLNLSCHVCGSWVRELLTGTYSVIAELKYEFSDRWPHEWDEQFKRRIKKKDIIGRLTVAGALIAAEIDRLQRRANG